jgi:hypothetical protein
MAKPPARPLIRCAPVLLAAAASILGSVVSPGVALSSAAFPGALHGAALPSAALHGAALPSAALHGAALHDGALPGGATHDTALRGSPELAGQRVAALPDVGGLLPPVDPLLARPEYLDALRPAAMPRPVPPGALIGAVQPVDPDGWFDEEPDDPAPDEPAPDEPAPDEPAPDDLAPADPAPNEVPGPDAAVPAPAQPAPPDAAVPAPAQPAPPAAPVRPSAAPPPPAATDNPPRRTRPASPSPRHRRTPTPADTRGLDELFPDRPSANPTPGAGGSHGSPTDPGSVGYARPLIYSGIAGMLVSAIGIGVVLTRRRGW